MAWIELHDTLPDHKKVLAVAEILKMDKDLVVGKLVRLWTWALNNREDGVFRNRDIPTIAEIMRYKGKPQRLVDALMIAQLLDCKDGEYIIHDWDERVGMLLAKRETTRAKTRERVKQFRERQRNEGCNTLQDSYSNANGNACNAATVPYRTLDDDDVEVDAQSRARARMRAREDEPDECELAYADARYAIYAAYKSSFGREPTTAETEQIARIAICNDKAALIDDAIHRAAAHGAKSVPGYIKKIIDEWRYQCIDTKEELAEYDFLADCIAGKVPGGMDTDEAFAKLDEHRKAKRNAGGRRI